MSSNDTKEFFFLPEVKYPVSADTLCNLLKRLYDISVRVYSRIEFERF
jgi:hypothetical protein